MTEATAKSKRQAVQITLDDTGITAFLGDAKIKVSPEGNAVVFTDKAVTLKPSANMVLSAGTEDQISVARDSKTVSINGVKAELDAEGNLVVSAHGKIRLKPAHAEDTPEPAQETADAAPRPVEEEPVETQPVPALEEAADTMCNVDRDAAVTAVHNRQPEKTEEKPPVEDTMKPGTEMADGSVYGGLTPDGKARIFVMPQDFSMTMTFNEAAKAVNKLNRQRTLGHSDWRIPTLENFEVLYKNRNEGKLKNSFRSECKGLEGHPLWYSTAPADDMDPSGWVAIFRPVDGFKSNLHKNHTSKISCRAVRLEPVRP